MTTPAIDAVSYLLGTLFNLYAVVVALRFVMQLVRADYYNPLAQFIVRATDPLLVPLRRVIPSVRRYDTASLLLCAGVLFIKFLLFKLLSLGVAPAVGTGLLVSAIPVPMLLIAALVDLVHVMFNVFIFALIIQAILSWIPGAQGNPVQELAYTITAPVLAPVRRVIPAIGGLDLSVFVTILLLFTLQIFVVGTLTSVLLGG